MLIYYLSLIDTKDDKLKFEEIYYKYSKLMKYTASSILNDDRLAEDAVHDAFIKLIKYLDKIEDVDSTKTKAFIIKITKSVTIDNQRKEERERVLSIGEIGRLKAYNHDLLENINLNELIKIIKKLPDIHRDILELKAYHKLSDKQIADILGISHDAARKRLERARAALIKITSNQEE